MSVKYIDRLTMMSDYDKLKRLEQRFVECQQELGYYKNLAARYKAECGKLELKIRAMEREEEQWNHG